MHRTSGKFETCASLKHPYPCFAASFSSCHLTRPCSGWTGSHQRGRAVQSRRGATRSERTNHGTGAQAHEPEEPVRSHQHGAATRAGKIITQVLRFFMRVLSDLRKFYIAIWSLQQTCFSDQEVRAQEVRVNEMRRRLQAAVTRQREIELSSAT